MPLSDADNAAPPPDVLRFSTNDLPERDRVAIFREVFGHHIMRVMIEFWPETSLLHEATMRKLHGVSYCSISTTGFRAQRARGLLSDGLDDVVLNINLAGTGCGTQFGREELIAPHEGCLVLSGDPLTFDYMTPGRMVVVSAPRSTIAPMVNGLEDCGPRVPQTEAMRLLATYILNLEQQSLSSLELSQNVSAHLQDLLALAIGPTRDALETAQVGAVRAARLVAIRREIGRSFNDRLFSLAVLASRLGVTQRYVQKLLADRDTSFVDEIIKLRLGRAHDMLSSQRHTSLNVTDIAHECGFSTVSHFHRMFRRRYGMTPSDVRAAAKKQ